MRSGSQKEISGMRKGMNQLGATARGLWALGLIVLIWFGAVPLGQADPFGTPVKYPRIPALVIGEVKVGGEMASQHDTVAAYVGGELRGCLLYTSPSPRD